MSQKSIKVDPEGFLVFDEVRVTDEEFGRSALGQIFRENDLFFTEISGEKISVEAFDAPYVVSSIEKLDGATWNFRMPYGLTLSFDLRKLCLDDWDRFCGHFSNHIPFVFSRKAQADFFNSLDGFSDDSITIEGEEIPILPKYKNSKKISGPEFWNEFYISQNTPWDLGEASPVLKQALLQLKLPRQRVLVLGAGRGHDAAEIARAGHVVTAVDISEPAKKDFLSKYSNVRDLTYVVADAFDLPAHFYQSFDLVIDHTFFVAIEPRRRSEVVQVWKKALVPGGHLLAIFFLFDRMEGPENCD